MPERRHAYDIRAYDDSDDRHPFLQVMPYRDYHYEYGDERRTQRLYPPDYRCLQHRDPRRLPAELKLHIAADHLGLHGLPCIACVRIYGDPVRFARFGLRHQIAHRMHRVIRKCQHPLLYDAPVKCMRELLDASGRGYIEFLHHRLRGKSRVRAVLALEEEGAPSVHARLRCRHSGDICRILRIDIRIKGQMLERDILPCAVAVLLLRDLGIYALIEGRAVCEGLARHHYRIYIVVLVLISEECQCKYSKLLRRTLLAHELLVRDRLRTSRVAGAVDACQRIGYKVVILKYSLVISRYRARILRVLRRGNHGAAALDHRIAVLVVRLFLVRGRRAYDAAQELLSVEEALGIAALHTRLRTARDAADIVRVLVSYTSIALAVRDKSDLLKSYYTSDILAPALYLRQRIVDASGDDDTQLVLTAQHAGQALRGIEVVLGVELVVQTHRSRDAARVDIPRYITIVRAVCYPAVRSDRRVCGTSRCRYVLGGIRDAPADGIALDIIYRIA